MDPLNRQIAARLDEVAQVLEEQGANRFRVRAYRRGADVVRGLRRPVDAILREGGLGALEALPGIGESLARSIRDVAATGRLPMLDRLRSAADPTHLLMTIPGIGRRTAVRLHDDLGIETLEELEAAAHDGRLGSLLGLGAKRLAGIRESLAERLARARPAGAPSAPDPPADELLDVDAEYRARAAEGSLPRITPRRFNPKREPWLPILHTQRGDRHYTALFSNSARAHRLGTTRDWVVIYLEAGGEQRYTVITSQRGPLAGRRVVAGLRSGHFDATNMISTRPSGATRPVITVARVGKSRLNTSR